MIEYPSRLALAQLPTPLQPLRRLQQARGGPLVWLKRDDLTGAELSGNKVRKLEFLLAEAQQQGCDALITCGGIQSNHCRATALAAARLGMRCHLILRGLPAADSDGNQLLDELCGASCEYHRPAQYFTRLDTLFAEAEQRLVAGGHKVLAIPTGGSNGIGVWGYIEACRELSADFARHGIAPAAILSATGSGGTQAGLVAGQRIYQLGAEVFGINVCDDEDYFKQKVSDDLAQWQQRYTQARAFGRFGPDDVHVIDGYVGEGYARAGAPLLATIAEIARLEGIVLDPVYSGKAFHGLLQEIERGRFADASDLVFIHTGGIFGLFPYREQLAELPKATLGA